MLYLSLLVREYTKLIIGYKKNWFTKSEEYNTIMFNYERILVCPLFWPRLIMKRKH